MKSRLTADVIVRLNLTWLCENVRRDTILRRFAGDRMKRFVAGADRGRSLMRLRKSAAASMRRVATLSQ